MNNKRAQSAMEYLMTYGWAILVVLIALGALFYLGVFSPTTPATCTTTAPITCTDVQALADGTVTVVLGSVGTSSAVLNDITLVSPNAQNCLLAAAISEATPTGISCDTGGAISGKFSGTGKITYQLDGSTINHNADVQFSGTVE